MSSGFTRLIVSAINPDPFLPLLGVYRGVHGLDQRALAGAPRAPQQGVVGRQAAGEPARVVEQPLGLRSDAPEQFQRHHIDRFHRLQPLDIRAPDEGVGGPQLGACGYRWRNPFQRFGDTLEQGVFVCHFVAGGD